jgi:hypothetical protein
MFFLQITGTGKDLELLCSVSANLNTILSIKILRKKDI